MQTDVSQSPPEPTYPIGGAWRTWRRHLIDALVNGFIGGCGPIKVVTSPGYIAIDPHIHSLYSKCSTTSIERILLRASRIGLSAIAIMDHNDLRSAEHAASCAQDLKRRKLIPEDFIVIPGMEIGTGAGHIGALFVSEPIPRKLGVAGTVQRIHDVGGLAVAVHPYLRSGIGDAVFGAPFDAVEIESGSVFGRMASERALKLLDDDRMKHAARLGSSDAHFANAIGMCYTLIRASEITPASIRSAMEYSSCTAHASGACLRIRRLLGGFPLHG